MTTDLMMLTWSAVLCVLLAVPYTIGLTQKLGLTIMVGNREDFPDVEGWIGRSIRAHRNMVENLAPFAALVLVAHVAGKANSGTALGAQIFFWARIVHAGAYIGGVVWLRTVAWTVSVIGMLLILMAIIR
jgi:uncharacterized MAPEG superfamily protein